MIGGIQDALSAFHASRLHPLLFSLHSRGFTISQRDSQASTFSLFKALITQVLAPRLLRSFTPEGPPYLRSWPPPPPSPLTPSPSQPSSSPPLSTPTPPPIPQNGSMPSPFSHGSRRSPPLPTSTTTQRSPPRPLNAPSSPTNSTVSVSERWRPTGTTPTSRTTSPGRPPCATQWLKQ